MIKKLLLVLFLLSVQVEAYSATLYLKAAGGTWSSASTWSNVSSADTDNSGPPTAADDVILDDGSGNLTIDGGAVCRSLDTTSGAGNYNSIITQNSATTITIGDGTAGAGNVALKLNASVVWNNSTASRAISFVSTSVTQQTINFAGVAASREMGNFTINGVGSSYQLTGTFLGTTTDTTITLTNGTLDLNGQTVSTGLFSSTNANTRVLTTGASAITLTGTGTVWNFATVTGLTFTSTGSTITTSNTSATAKTFAGGGLTYATATFSGDNITISGDNTFSVFNVNTAGLTNGLKITSLSTQTITTTFATNGSAGNLAKLVSSSAGSAGILSKLSGTVSVDYMSIQDSTATGGAVWNAGLNSVDVSGNSGWIFGTGSNSASSTTIDEDDEDDTYSA